MKASFSHLQINIDPKNLPFYKELFAFLGWSVIHEAEGMAGFSNGEGYSLWCIPAIKNESGDYDTRGVNHIGLSVPEQGNVDEVVQYLKDHSIEQLFETPRHRPDFAMSESETYYQVMFESPDKVLFEIVYTGPKK